MHRPRILVLHGGGPTAVLNSSLYGVLAAADGCAVYGARNGIAGLQAGDLIDLSGLSAPQRALLMTTPGTAIGSSRTPLAAADYPALVGQLQRLAIDHVLLSGGNGTMTTAQRLAEAAATAGITVNGIPKTIDNDLAGTDHAPGYLSAAQYVRQTVQEIAADVHSLPLHVVVVEVMGRDAGWLAAAGALVPAPLAPDAIWLPEHPLALEPLMAQLATSWATHHRALVVVAEGASLPDGTPLATMSGRGVGHLYQGAGAALAAYIGDSLGVKVRAEAPGLAGRASMATQVPRDRNEAIAAGRAAVAAALAGQTGQMVSLSAAGQCHLVPLTTVTGRTRRLPAAYIAPDGRPSAAFQRWLTPLLPPPSQFLHLN